MIKAADVHATLSRLKGYSGTYIKEFTWWGDCSPGCPEQTQLRIDGLLIDTAARQTHGFEIKVDLYDWRRDKKWQLYRAFCSTLSVACPEGLIDLSEIPPGYGLLWVNKLGRETWIRRPRKIEKDPAEWKDTYLKILENEFPRMQQEIRTLKAKKYAAKVAPGE